MRLTLPNPISANRYWRHYGHKVVISREASAFKREVQIRALEAGIKNPMSGPIKVAMTYHPKARKKETDAPLRRLDLGNVEKVANDALNGIAWVDDKQIVNLQLILADPVENGALIVEWEAV